MALLDGTVRSATAVALTDCKLLPVAESRFQALVRHTPAFAWLLMQLMAARLRHSTARVAPTTLTDLPAVQPAADVAGLCARS